MQIPHLRSPAVHHPDPNPFALRRFAESRPQELHSPYDLPGTQLFEEFCQDIVDRWQLEDHVFPGQVVRIEPVPEGRRLRFRLWLAQGQSILARRVVVANRGGTPHFPDWVKQISTPYPGDRLCHSSQIDLRSTQLQGEQVLIIGGGLTSGHLAIGAIASGAKVALMHRRQFYEKLFELGDCCRTFN
ncbi:MAG: lysine N(6)-hydroxylase/L-ornithine N(5)-oxygenase family protein [Aphanocapsa sp. GSE-SYN-MK-11-07L]|nr:lysine N(6)-hydroxylase/L-ornithine N(5)-oxygenase family protein [Aphanocapsa sp. GSE-SYN-MK-11-07L]